MKVLLRPSCGAVLGMLGLGTGQGALHGRLWAGRR